jgi:hypothetical protein
MGHHIYFSTDVGHVLNDNDVPVSNYS